VAALVTPTPKSEPPTYAVAVHLRDDGRKASAGFQQVSGDGVAAFELEAARSYDVAAFTDENGNRALDAGEPLGIQRNVRPSPLGDPDAAPKLLPIRLTRDHRLKPGTVIQVPKESRDLGGKVNLEFGAVASLDEKRFSADAGGSGLWRPLEFLSKDSVGIYFTEPYDPDRIPLLLVYGIGGSPQDWKYFIDHLDRNRHQLWFFHYPSGMRLERVANALSEGMRLLRQKHRFSRLHLVAHSMGGLVAREALTEAVAKEGTNFIPRFVSISTPWGGHAAAELGIRHLKHPVPSWLDVAPNSAYLTRLYATPLPRGTRHHILYGSIEDGPFYLKGPNDGVVTVASETEPRIRRSASSATHYPYGHMPIINAKPPLAKVENLLAR
jgi:hypothetical protein